MKYFRLLIQICLTILVLSCSNTVNNNSVSISYKEILSASSGDINIKLYTTGYDSLTTGYNDIFFKVKKGSSYQNNGTIKLFPKMWMTPTYMHSTPVSASFNYDNVSGYYKGFAIFNMPTSPPEVIWYLNITYTDENNVNYEIDSVAAYTSLHMEKQWRIFYDMTDESSYFISLLGPFIPVKGMNQTSIMLHKTSPRLLDFTLLTEPTMVISVYEIDSVNHSSGNISPQAGSDGIYRGKINLPYSGQWNLCDTIFYNNHYITNNPPPMPEFNFTIH